MGPLATPPAMAQLTMDRRDIEAVVGPVPEPTMLALLGATPNREELLQALAWHRQGADILSADRPLPAGRVGLLVSILAEIGDPAAGVRPGAAP